MASLDFKRAFWRGIGFRVARAVWSLLVLLGLVFALLIAVSVVGHHIHRFHV